jgi:hypothetical protein
MPLRQRNHRARLPPEGFPGHVRGWCVKAGEGTMKQGYRDVGFLFAPHIRRFRPPAIPNYSWLRRVRALAAPVEAGNPAAVQQWFHAHYPFLMELIPTGLHQEFAAGVIERVAEIEAGEG